MRIPHNERLGSDSKDDGPERKCILSGAHAPRDALTRLAISPDGEVLPDVLARAPGRGAWIGVSRADLEIALAKGKLRGALARAFKGAPLSIPEDLPARIETALVRAFTDRLGLEMRAGRLLVGSDRIGENARAGRVAWLAHAADAGRMARASSTRPGAWARMPKVRARPVCACHWTGRLCLWHWAATTSSTWR